jgi:RimJ/RimL family protein N-acetyltransferase
MRQSSVAVSPPTVVLKDPSSCTVAELNDFTSFVMDGGEVSPNGLRDRICQAKCLAFLVDDAKLLGVAGLKQPTQNYRASIAKASDVLLPELSFSFELGWIYIAEAARGRGLSLSLCRSLVNFAGGKGIFATSKVENIAMHKTLAKLGFHSSGRHYESRRGGYALQLYLLDAPRR